MQGSAGPVMMALLSTLVIGSLANALWAEGFARAIALLPDMVRLPLMERLDRSDKAGGKVAHMVLDQMADIEDKCPSCHRRTDADELNFGKYRRCGRCAAWGRYPGMPEHERRIAEDLEREYTRILVEQGAEAAQKWQRELV